MHARDLRRATRRRLGSWTHLGVRNVRVPAGSAGWRRSPPVSVAPPRSAHALGDFRRGQRHVELLHPRGGARDEYHISRREAQRRRQQPDYGCVRGAVRGRGCDPHAEDACFVETQEFIS